VTLKFLATGVAAAAVLAGGAVSITPSASPAVELAVFGVPMPLDPAVDVPTADQLNGVLYGLADPGVPFASKSYLVEGGIGRVEARTADALMKNAVAKGQTPLNFSIGGISPAGPAAATATVTASGPGMAPTTQSVTFVDQGGWKLSRTSAATVLAIFS
jgi:hypothetical protein